MLHSALKKNSAARQPFSLAFTTPLSPFSETKRWRYSWKKWRTPPRHFDLESFHAILQSFFFDSLWLFWYQVGSFPKADVKTWSVMFLTDLNFLDCSFLQGWTPCWDGQLCLRPLYMAQRCCWTDVPSLKKMDTSLKQTPGDDPCLFLLF